MHGFNWPLASQFFRREIYIIIMKRLSAMGLFSLSPSLNLSLCLVLYFNFVFGNMFHSREGFLWQWSIRHGFWTSKKKKSFIFIFYAFDAWLECAYNLRVTHYTVIKSFLKQKQSFIVWSETDRVIAIFVLPKPSRLW